MSAGYEAVQMVLNKGSFMGEYRRVCRVGDLRDGEAIAAEVGGKLVAVFRVGEGYYAIDDVCPHMGGALSEGQVEGGIVTCPWHAWRFRLADGVWADNPRIRIGSYPVRVEDGWVQVLVDPNPGTSDSNNQKKPEI
jgi:nitrite reductase (NADH) small subunit/3-phenylpropionate/trans-cinnamate dioxygenase ferredoxin subunit